jgi:hypothetical protein
VQSHYANIANSVTWTNISSKPTTISGFGITDAYSNTNAGAYLSSYSGNVTAGNIKTDNLLYANGVVWSFNGTYSNSNVAAYLPTYSGNLTAGNINLSYTTTSTANLGNAVRANYFVGDGSGLTNIGSPANIFSGNSNVQIYTASNISISVGGTANTVVLTNSGNYIVTTGNVKAGYYFGDGSQLTGITSSYSNTNVAAYLPTYTGNVPSASVSYLANVQANSTSATSMLLTFVSATGNSPLYVDTTANDLTYQPSSGNLTAAQFVGNGYYLTALPTFAYSNTNTAAYLTANPPTGSYSNTNVAAYLPTYSGNLTAGNINLSFTTTSTANLGNAVRANYFVGNGSGLIGVTVTAGPNIVNSNSNVNIPSANSNVTISVNNTPNVVVVTSTGVNIAGTLNVTGVSNLGPPGNVIITGGGLGYLLQTDGSGTLSWASSGSVASGITQASTTLTISTNTLTISLASYVSFEVTLNATISTVTLTNVPSAGNFVSFVLMITGDGTARAITWPVSFKWPNGTAPSITSTLNKKDVFVFFTTDGGTSWEAMISGQNL